MLKGVKELPIDNIIKIGYKNIQKTIKFIDKKKLNNHFLHTSVNKIKKIDDMLDIKSWDICSVKLCFTEHINPFRG